MLGTFLALSHTCAFAIDPTEKEPKELPEPAQAEDTNLEHEHGKPRCI
jgi:hypothetical protein